MSWNHVLKFWFSELSPEDWFRKSQKVDSLIRERFGDIHRTAAQGLLTSWRTGPLDSLAEIIVLDQFSRNIWRNNPLAFASDPLALSLAEAAIAKGFHKELSVEQKSFLYMPFMHSESQTVHLRAVELFSEPGLGGSLGFELKHKEIIDRFGRYPHRNSILGRSSTPEELEFLKISPGF